MFGHSLLDISTQAWQCHETQKKGGAIWEVTFSTKLLFALLICNTEFILQAPSEPRNMHIYIEHFSCSVGFVEVGGNCGDAVNRKKPAKLKGMC